MQRNSTFFRVNRYGLLLAFSLFFLFFAPLFAQEQSTEDQFKIPALSSDSLNQMLRDAENYVEEGRPVKALSLYKHLLSYQEVIPLRVAWLLASVLHDLSRLKEAKRFLNFYQERLPAEDTEAMQAVSRLQKDIQNSLERTKTCIFCDDKGFLYIRHEACQGRGELSGVCPHCQGRGSHVCFRCKGQGVVIRYTLFGERKYLPCELCLSKKYTTCEICKGTGTQTQTCDTCQGLGHTTSKIRCLHPEEAGSNNKP